MHFQFVPFRGPELNELAQASAGIFIKGGGKPKTPNTMRSLKSLEISQFLTVLSQHFHFGLLRISFPSPFVIASCLPFCSHFFLFLHLKTTACSCSGCQNNPHDPPIQSSRLTPSPSGMYSWQELSHHNPPQQ